MWKPSKLYFGPAGIPHSVKKRSTKEGVLEVKRLGLDAMELEFVRRVNLKPEAAKEVKKVASELGVILTVHAPYYVNLSSKDKSKAEASVRRVLYSARIGYMSGAWSVCFHAGYYQNIDPAKVYEAVKSKLRDITKTLRDEGVEIWIRPETTGKDSQFGSLEEVLSLSQEVEMVMPVIDFAHLHARYKGELNTYKEFKDVLYQVERLLGKEGLRNMHIHISGIEYGDKGERKHLNLEESDMNYIDLLKALKDFKIKGVIICESPNLEEDALLLKRTYRNLK